MDIYCPKCGEPIDPYEFHDIAKSEGTTYSSISRRFQVEGCSAIGFNCSIPSKDRAMIASAMYDLLGDDLDGAAAMFEDFGL